MLTGRRISPADGPVNRSIAGSAGPLILLPAVDLSGGHVVRLVQGAPETEARYGDPLDVARGLQRAGAEWIHLVDLDAAFGRGSNAPLVASLVRQLDVAVELSGGIRDDASLAAAIATGCERVIIGTAALAAPEWARRVMTDHGDRIAVALDVRGERVRARGWTSDGGSLLQVLARLEDDGCSRYVVTDVTRDGTLTGPNLGLLRRVCARTGRPVVAGGGVSCLADLRDIAALRGLGVEGAIIGKALYAGAFTLEQALAQAATDRRRPVPDISDAARRSRPQPAY